MGGIEKVDGTHFSCLFVVVVSKINGLMVTIISEGLSLVCGKDMKIWLIHLFRFVFLGVGKLEFRQNLSLTQRLDNYFTHDSPGLRCPTLA